MGMVIPTSQSLVQAVMTANKKKEVVMDDVLRAIRIANESGFEVHFLTSGKITIHHNEHRRYWLIERSLNKPYVGEDVLDGVYRANKDIIDDLRKQLGCSKQQLENERKGEIE
jgi:hypothetical protein